MQSPLLLRSLGPRFTALWISQAFAHFGSAIAAFSIPILILYIQESTGSDATLDYSIQYALDNSSVILIGLVGGVLLDRWVLPRVVVVTNLLRACAFFFLAANVGEIGVGAVFAMSFLIGTMTTMFESALYAVLPSVVRKDRLADANSAVTITMQAADSIGPFLGGLVVATAGTPAVGLLLSGTLFALSAVAMHWVGTVPARRNPLDEKQPFFTEAANGVRYLWSEPRLRTTTITAGLANLTIGFVEGTFIPLATHVIGAPSEAAIGLLLGAAGVGGVVGAFFAPSLTRRFGLGRTLVLGLFIVGIGQLIFMFTSFGLIAVAFQAGWATGVSIVNIPIATIRQHYSSEAMLGRVITASRAIGWATLPIGALVGGWLGNSPETYPWVARSFPVILIVTALFLTRSVLWSDTFGPAFEQPAES